MTVQPGDIIFYLDDGALKHHVFTLLQKWTRNTGGAEQNFTHVAMIANDPDLVVEMRWPRPQFRFWADDTRPKVVMRPQVDPKIIMRAIYWCYMDIGDHYSFLNMALGGLGITKVADRFCSGWILTAFRESGADLLAGSHTLVSPDQFSTSKLLVEVTA